MWVGRTDRAFKNDQADQWFARVEPTISLIGAALYASLFRSARQQSTSVRVTSDLFLSGQKSRGGSPTTVTSFGFN